jgi:hypothetical protein
MNRTWITLIARRSAGVWTHLPSITASVLADLGRPCTALWVDLGMRYEMLNHLAIPPGSVNVSQCLSGLARARRGGAIPQARYIELSECILGLGDRSVPPLSVHTGADGEAYITEVRRWSEAGARTYMLPHHAPDAPAMSIVRDIDLSDFAATIQDAADGAGAELVFLTCEGQPEARLFELELRRRMLLPWALDTAALIVTLVRHDSVARFQDSVAIPTILSRQPSWRGKLRLILTRSADTISSAPGWLQALVLGRLPFSDFIGQSVSKGKIPYFDALLSAKSPKPDLPAVDYLSAVRQVADVLVSEARLERPSPLSAPVALRTVTVSEGGESGTQHAG